MKKLFFIVVTFVVSTSVLASDQDFIPILPSASVSQIKRVIDINREILCIKQKKLWDSLVSETQKLIGSQDTAPVFIPYKPWMTAADRYAVDNMNTMSWSQYRVTHYNKDKLNDENWKKSTDIFIKYLEMQHKNNTAVNNNSFALKNSEKRLTENQAKFLELQMERNQQHQDQLMLQNSIEGLRGDLLTNELMQKRSTLCQSLGAGTAYCF